MRALIFSAIVAISLLAFPARAQQQVCYSIDAELALMEERGFEVEILDPAQLRRWNTHFNETPPVWPDFHVAMIVRNPKQPGPIVISSGYGTTICFRALVPEDQAKRLLAIIMGEGA